VALPVDSSVYAQLIVIFTSIIYEALPFVVLGVLLAGLLEEFVPQQLIARIIPKGKVMTVAAIALGGWLGLLFPMCECGIIPVMRRLLRKGIPLSVCVCYMLAGPIINVVVVASTAAAFSGQRLPLGYGQELPLSILFPIMRVALGFLVAFVTSLIVEWQFRVHGNALLSPMVVKDTMVAASSGDESVNGGKRSWGQSLGNICETAMHDFIDIMAFLVLGAFLAAGGRLLVPFLGVEEIIRGSPIIAIAVMMGLAIIFCICSEADAFVAANMQPVGLWPLSSKLGFLVLGPMLDFKLYMMYTRVFSQRLIWTIISCVAIQVFVYSVIIHYVGVAWLSSYGESAVRIWVEGN
jgi:uncharacterized membrane protein YraQ (UPF0718 family)